MGTNGYCACMFYPEKQEIMFLKDRIKIVRKKKFNQIILHAHTKDLPFPFPVTSLAFLKFT